MVPLVQGPRNFRLLVLSGFLASFAAVLSELEREVFSQDAAGIDLMVHRESDDQRSIPSEMSLFVRQSTTRPLISQDGRDTSDFNEECPCSLSLPGDEAFNTLPPH